jgi:hypothetical protein
MAYDENMTIYVFGNPDLPADSLPLKILPELQRRFPQLHFEIKDPNEEWDCPGELTVIDTVQGIERVAVFDDLAKFSTAPRLTMHDFDALTNLRYLRKLGKLKKIKIIGVPAEMNPKEALESVAEELSKVST